MQYTIEPTDEGKQLIVNGELTIEQAGELKNALLEILEGSSKIGVDLQGVTAVDLSALQLFCSAHRTAAGANKSFVLENAGFEVFARAVEDAGYGRKKGCLLDPDASCIWKGEKR